MTHQVNRLAVLVLIGSLMAIGCSSVKETFRSKPDVNKVVVVELFDPVAGSDVPITVNAGGSAESVEAIKHMQNDDFDKAVTVLKNVQASGKADDRDLFALGVALEKLDQLEPAVEAYKAANLKKSNDIYQASRRRATDKMK